MNIDSALYAVNGGVDSSDAPPATYSMLMNAILQGSRTANALPGSAERIFVESDPDFMNRSAQLGNRVLDLAAALMEQVRPVLAASVRRDIKQDPADFEPFELCSEILDVLTEDIDAALDEAQGITANTQQVNVKRGELAPVEKGAAAAHMPGRNIKPQTIFTTPVDNSRGHFKPLLTRKPHARVPLASFSGPGPFPHPYEYEIQHLAYEDWMTSKNTEEAFAGLDSVPFMYVDTAAALDHLIQLLSAEDVREVAIDLEAHSIRSYSGICCLMQLSTRRLDAVVDTLALRSEMHKFLDIFTNPAVVKVLHGSKFDVLWLQRDFGLYLVNVFDTGEAARVLKYASFGLAHLLDLFCKVKAQKQFQLADWRLRPIPADMLKYAREDTHYLLGIYDRMKNELLDTSTPETGSLLIDVLNLSSRLALGVFDKEQFTPDSYVQLLESMHLSLRRKQESVFAALFDWRDAVAREEDESVHYVMPRRALLALCTHMPVNMDQLVLACNPIPAVVRARAQEVLNVIALAKEHELHSDAAAGSGGDDVSAHSVRIAEAVARQQQVARSFLPVTPVMGVIVSPTLMTPSPEIVTPSPQAGLTAEQLFSMAKWQALPESRLAEMQGARSPTPMALAFDDDDIDDESSAGNTGHGRGLGADSTSYASLAPVKRKRTAAAAAAGKHSTTDDGPKREERTKEPLITSDILPIPRSLDEIYAISNRNRQQNQGKRLGTDRTDSGMSESDAPGEDADMSAGVDADARDPVVASGTPMEFMQRIGWLSSDGRPLEPGKTLVGAGADPTASSAAVPLPHFDYDGIAPSKAFGSALQSVQAPEPSTTGRSARGGRGGARGGAANLAAPRVSTSNPYMIAGVAGKSPGKPDKGRFRADVPRVGKGGSVFGAERSSGFAPSKK